MEKLDLLPTQLLAAQQSGLKHATNPPPTIAPVQQIQQAGVASHNLPCVVSGTRLGAQEKQRPGDSKFCGEVQFVGASRGENGTAAAWQSWTVTSSQALATVRCAGRRPRVASEGRRAPLLGLVAAVLCQQPKQALLWLARNVHVVRERVAQGAGRLDVRQQGCTGGRPAWRTYRWRAHLGCQHSSAVLLQWCSRNRPCKS